MSSPARTSIRWSVGPAPEPRAHPSEHRVVPVRRQPREAPIPLQVLASPTDGVAKPFAVVLRLSATGDDRANDHPVSINGWQVSITDWGNGNQQAAWTLPDGTWAYLRARDLDEPTLVALISRLTPRGPGAPIPGFDLAPSTAPDDLTLLHEHLNTDLSGTVTRFQCSTEPNQGIYHIDVVQGDPVFVYFGVLDRPRPYTVGVNGSGAITILGAFTNRALTLTDITDADPATWDALPEIGPFGADALVPSFAGWSGAAGVAEASATVVAVERLHHVPLHFLHGLQHQLRFGHHGARGTARGGLCSAAPP